MKVVNTQPFQLVYTLIDHKDLGCIIEPHVVQVSSKGLFTLTHQRIFTRTSDYFSSGLDETDYKIIRILDELEPEFIVKKFYKDKKNKIRPAQFFAKYCTEDLFTNFIRPFIEARLAAAIALLPNKPFYKNGNDNNPASVQLFLAEEAATVLFHFRRNEEGTRYFPTIKYKGERIEFMYKGASLITTQPAWMLLENKVYNFAKNLDGKKLLPFFNKRFIQIPKSAEANYFSKFVIQLIEKYDVYAEGFEILTESIQAKPVLKMEDLWEDNARLLLYFKYGKYSFPFHSEQKVSVAMEQKDDNYIFRRIRRASDWEIKQKAWLESIGLMQAEGSGFSLGSATEKEEGETFSGSNKYQILRWLNSHLPELEERGFIIEQSSETNKYFLGKSEIRFEVEEFSDWFDVNAIVRFGNYEFPFHRLKENILRGKRELILPSGEIALIPEEWFGNYGSLFEFSMDDEKIQLKKFHLGLIYDLPQNSGISGSINEKLSKLRDQTEIEDVELPENFNGSLRPYQKAGYNWFYFLKNNGFGGCLADDMGLGKTIQTLCFLQKEKELRKKEKSEIIKAPVESNEERQRLQLALFGSETIPPAAPQRSAATSLVVVPTSLIFNWHNESSKFAPDLKILVYTGTYREKNLDAFSHYDVILSTYGTVRVDLELLEQFYFHYIILDESQSIKNPSSQVARAVKSLKASHRLVLTGTPIENSLTELWSQLSFTNPGLLGGYKYFTEEFVIPIEKHKDEPRIKKLRSLVHPFILRRTKKQVADDLPNKIDQVIYCEMSDEQKKEYEKIKSDYRNELLKSIQEDRLSSSQMTVIQGLTKLRQLANHPKLTNPEYEGTSGKFDEVTQMVDTALAEGHKLLLFSQFVKQLHIYKKHFDDHGIEYCYLDGSTNTNDRKKEVERFQNDESIKVFLISLKAGGLGLNLTAADYVFIIDPWWNPAVERQAEDRTHRIGQTRTVFTYKFITRDTLEEKIMTLQQKKKELADTLITTEESFIKKLNVEDLLEIFN